MPGLFSPGQVQFRADREFEHTGTSVEMIPISEVESSAVQRAVATWKKWRGMHAMPSRDKISLRDLGPATRHVSLARVVDDGADYEFRVIGDAHVQAYGTNYQNKRISDVIAVDARFGRQLKASYDLVRITRRPCAFRGTLGYEIQDAHFAWYETCYLPLGDGVVDHIINAAVYTHRITG
ncbi:MAG TPA: hypothetical protein VHL34_11265 [Rhizomicrobium sp.]|nr:hypothetical protein [Rhizomicrobium sp.]